MSTSIFRVDFVNQYCYVHGTYFVPLEEGLDYSPLERRKFPINYYQWVMNKIFTIIKVLVSL